MSVVYVVELLSEQGTVSVCVCVCVYQCRELLTPTGDESTLCSVCNISSVMCFYPVWKKLKWGDQTIPNFAVPRNGKGPNVYHLSSSTLWDNEEFKVDVMVVVSWPGPVAAKQIQSMTFTAQCFKDGSWGSFLQMMSLVNANAFLLAHFPQSQIKLSFSFFISFLSPLRLVHLQSRYWRPQTAPSVSPWWHYNPEQNVSGLHKRGLFKMFCDDVLNHLWLMWCTCVQFQACKDVQASPHKKLLKFKNRKFVSSLRRNPSKLMKCRTGDNISIFTTVHIWTSVISNKDYTLLASTTSTSLVGLT